MIHLLLKDFIQPLSFNSVRRISFTLLFFLILPLNSVAQSEKTVLPEEKNYENSEVSSDPFLQAEHLFHSGELIAAKPYYHEYLDRNTRGQRRPNALFRLGLIDQKEKSFSTAIRFYKMLLGSHPKALLAHDVRFNMAVCNYELGHLDTAEELFNAVLRQSPDKKKKWQALYFLSQLDGRRLSFEEAIGKLKKIYAQVDDKELSRQALRLAEEMIDEKFSEMILSSLIQKYRSGFPVDLLFLKKLSLFREQGDVGRYESVLVEFLSIFPEHAKSEELKNDLEEIRKGNVAKVVVGVVLPLTGKLAATGQKVLQGIQLAYSRLPEESRQMIALDVKDSSDVIGLEKTLSDLARNPRVVGVLGPLLSDEIKRAGAVADSFRIPVFSPTASSAGLVESSSYVFRNALTRKIQARFLAEYSINTLKLRRFVILHPLEPFGEELKDEFLQAVEAFGGEVVGIASYDRSQNDFKKQILELGGIADDDLIRMTRKQLLDNEAQEDFSDPVLLSRPRVDMEHWSEDEIENLKVSLELSYDAMFIPGVYDKVGLIIPQLAFYNIEKIALLGAKGWNSPELVKMGGKFLKSVYFVDGFYLNSHQVRVRKFVELFKSNYGEPPSHFSAQAYDAAGIFFKSITSGADNRLKLRDSLVKVKNYPGVTGKTSMLESGDSEKNIFALTVKRKKIVEDN
ncbi:penicillin-binding protein activator [bacterium AH-315-C08]|nr:penicillin-binding protein activator [bacterium AH-315-C08]